MTVIGPRAECESFLRVRPMIIFIFRGVLASYLAKAAALTVGDVSGLHTDPILEDIQYLTVFPMTSGKDSVNA